MEAPARIRINPRYEVFEAARDFLYLLNRGYSRKAALNLVSSRWLLSRIERLLLYRSIYPLCVALQRRTRLIAPREVRGRRIVVDGFNIVSTAASALLGDTLIEGNDGVVRDLAATVRKVKPSPIYYDALLTALALLSRLSPLDAVWVFDSQISMSASFAEIAGRWWRSELSRKADRRVIEMAGRGYIAATSDSVIIDNVNALLDLGGYIARIVSPHTILSMTSVSASL